MILKSIRRASLRRALAGAFLLTFSTGLLAAEFDYKKYPQPLTEAEIPVLVAKIAAPEVAYDAWSADYDKLLYDGLAGWKAIMTAEADPDPRFDRFRERQDVWEIGQYPKPLLESFFAFHSEWLLDKTESREWTQAWVKADLNRKGASSRFRRHRGPDFAQDQLSVLRNASLGREGVDERALPQVRLSFEYYTAFLQIELKHHPWSTLEEAVAACAEAIAWWKDHGDDYIKEYGYGTNFFFSVAEAGTEKHPLDAAVEALCTAAAGSTEEITTAFREGLKLWDEEMNRVYQELRKVLSKKSFAALKTSQVKWLASRKAQITFINSCYDQYPEEEDQPMRASAIMEVTRSRTLDLTSRLQVHKEQAEKRDPK